CATATRSVADRSSESSANCPLYAVGGPGRVIVLPNSNDVPLLRPEGAVRRSIALTICSDFGPPPRAIRLGKRSVIGTTVPETTVNEYRNASAGKHEVGSPSSPAR